MTFVTTLFTEGWPLFLALALVFFITFGALRPYLKKDRVRLTPKKDATDD